MARLEKEYMILKHLRFIGELTEIDAARLYGVRRSTLFKIVESIRAKGYVVKLTSEIIGCGKHQYRLRI